MSSALDSLICPIAKRLHENHMSRLGIANTMRLARAYNHFKYGKQDAWRRRLFSEQLTELLAENGAPTRPRVEMKDGWAIDRSMSLPHLDQLLAESDKIIAERAGVRLSAGGAYRSYFQDMWTPADLETYPSYLDFATSSDVLAVVASYLKCIPALTTTLPSGIRVVESNAAYDDQPGNPRDSQLYHIDYYSLPNVYVLVLLQDATSEHGPWTFLPRSVSMEAKARLNYYSRRRGYRMSDDDVYSVVDRKNVIEFAEPRGTVLFIESSGCLHYGSRNSVKPRFQAMFGYSGACRTDFTEAFMTPKVYPIRESDSLIRKMVLDKNRAPQP